jgi:hypothetical protein
MARRPGVADVGKFYDLAGASPQPSDKKHKLRWPDNCLVNSKLISVSCALSIGVQTMRIHRSIVGVLLGLAFGGFGMGAHAAPFTVSLDGVTFADGGSASGSFLFDPSLGGSASNITVATTSVGPFLGANYSGGSASWNVLNYQSGGSYYDIIGLYSGTGDVMLLMYQEPDANAGADIAANPGAFVTVAHGFSPFGPSYEQSTYTDGDGFHVVNRNLADVAVPEPGSLLVLGSALAGLGALRRRNR